MAGITVKIGGEDKTEYVDAQTLSIRDELTSKVDSASFDFICNDIAIAPKPGEEVLIEEGTKKLFLGRILSKEESFLPPNLLKYPVECIDHTRDLDKKLVYESYHDQKAGDIYKNIIDKYTTGFTYNNVSDDPIIISEITFDYVQVSDALTKIAEICGYEWYVDYDKDIHFFAKNTYPAPFQLDDDQANYKDLIIDTDISQIRNRVFVKSSNIKDFVGEAFVADGVSTEWECMFKAENLPLTFLTSSFALGAKATKIQFSHNDVYLAVGYTKYHCLKVWKREGDEFTALSFFSITPDTDVFAVAWSSDDIYLAAAYNAGSKIRVWKRDNDKFTALDVFADLPAGIANDVQFSPDDTYLAAVNDGIPYIIIYKREGDIFTKLDNPIGGLPAGNANGVRWSPDGIYLAVAHDVSPYVTIYKREGDIFIKLPDPIGGLPAGNGNSISWSPDGIYMVVAHAVTPFITIYKRDGDTFTKMTNPDNLPTGDANDVDFSADGMQLAVGHNITPFLTIYKHTTDLFIKQDDPEELPDDNVCGIDFSSSGIYLAVGCETFHYLTVYKQHLLTITVDGVIKTIGWDGVDNPLYYDFMLNEVTKVLSIGAAGAPMIDIGTSLGFSESAAWENYTHIIKSNPANETGKITQIEIYARQNISNCKVATFYRPDPDNFPNKLSTRDTEFIGTVISGSKQIFEVDLNVVEGDYIGIHFTAGSIYATNLGEDLGMWWIYEDEIPCTNQTFEEDETYTISLYGTGYTEKGELAIGSEILVGYYSIGIPICLKRDDQNSIDSVKAIEGGDGIIEFCITDNKIDNIAWASEVAKADLLQNANPVVKATFITNRSDIKSGQIITLNSTKRNINQQFIVQSVELVRVDVIEYYGTAEIPYKPLAETVIDYKPAIEAEVPYKPADSGGEVIYYIFNVTIANKFKKLEDLFLYLLSRSEES